MTTPPRGFDDAEFAARCTHAQAAMARADVGALLLTSEAEIRYFTGFMSQFWQSPTRPWFVVIPSSGKPVAVIPSIGAPLMRQCYTENIISWASPAAHDDGITLTGEKAATWLVTIGMNSSSSGSNFMDGIMVLELLVAVVVVVDFIVYTTLGWNPFFFFFLFRK